MATSEASIERHHDGIEWRRAWQALRQVMDDPEKTGDAIEVIDALSGPSFDRAYARFKAHPSGRQLLRERPDLVEVLKDREALARMPAGSLGQAYLARIRSAGVTPEGLVEADEEREQTEEPVAEDADRDFFGTRLRDAHDLWHVVTGYGMDDAGEAAVVAFSHGQCGLLGFGALALAAAALGPHSVTLTWERYLYRAWRRGRRAKRLDLAPWERWLTRPLRLVRADLCIEDPDCAHPAGVIVATLDRFPAGA